MVAAGYTVLAVNPLQATRFRGRLGVSGAKSDAGDAHVLADMVRTHAHALRPVAGDSVLAEARRKNATEKAAVIQTALLRTQHLGQPEIVATAYAASIQALIAPVLGARVLAEFGDDPHRCTSAEACKNYAGASPITHASGKKKVALARFIHNARLIDALMTQAFNALLRSPGARGYYDRQRARGASHNAALRQLADRLVGIGCLRTGTVYDETTAWSHHVNKTAA